MSCLFIFAEKLSVIQSQMICAIPTWVLAYLRLEIFQNRYMVIIYSTKCKVLTAKALIHWHLNTCLCKVLNDFRTYLSMYVIKIFLQSISPVVIVYLCPRTRHACRGQDCLHQYRHGSQMSYINFPIYVYIYIYIYIHILFKYI